jgi:hypothetical protein
MMGQEILNSYKTQGIEVDATKYLTSCGSKISTAKAESFARDRWKNVEAVLPHVGLQITESDFGHNTDPEMRSLALESFSTLEKQDIARTALYLEAAPSHIYWDEAAERFFPEIDPANASTYAEDVSCENISRGILGNISALLSRRSREQSELRGDNDSLNAFSEAITSPHMNLPPSLRCDLAAHCVAHSRIYQRTKGHFNALVEGLPKEADPVCEAIRASGLEPEILESHSFLSKLDNRDFEHFHKTAQNDILTIARTNLSYKVPGQPEVPIDRRTDLRSQIAATQKLVNQGEKDGLYSQASERANRNIFALSKLTGHADVFLVPYEVVRQERTRAHTRQNAPRSNNIAQEM